jgi:hypothetical protein
MAEVVRDCISKCLDRILVSESLLTNVGRYQSWVDLPFVSDHALVVVHFDLQPFLIDFPFKLNPSWLAEVDFATIVSEVWKILDS